MDLAAVEPYRKLDEGGCLVNARAELAEPAEGLGIELPAGACSTLAGFNRHKTGSIPAQGTRIDVGRYALTVDRCTARHQGSPHLLDGLNTKTGVR